MKTKAEAGDKAQFNLPSGKNVFGKILHVPKSVGDPWIVLEFFEGREGAVVYIQQFEAMFLRQQT